MVTDYFTAKDVISKDFEITPVLQRMQRFFSFLFFPETGKTKTNLPCGACSVFQAVSITDLQWSYSFKSPQNDQLPLAKIPFPPSRVARDRAGKRFGLIRGYLTGVWSNFRIF